jgi:amidophosphoribosyltransferase
MCGVFGVYGHPDAAHLAYLGLYALQHRGEEGAGIVAYNGKRIRMYKNLGLVGNVFSQTILRELKGHLAVAHVRYSTTGTTLLKNVQPFLADHPSQPIAIAHNGNFVNTVEIRRKLEEEGAIFQTTADSELILHLLAKRRKTALPKKLVEALAEIKGSYALVMMVGDSLIGARDPFGFKPLCLGQLDSAYILTNETCVLDLLGAEYLREVDPGEIILINQSGLESIRMPFQKKTSFCIFEFIYFARPDSNIFGKSVYQTRKRLGQKLGEEFAVSADLVVPIPDSGNYAALGFAETRKIPYEIGLIRNHYIGRTFIQPSQVVRNFRVKIKLNPIREVLKGKEVVIVEDSIVRGTTIRSRVNILREFGAKKVYMGVSCPPIKFPCFYGIDFPQKKELIASNHSISQIQEFIGLDALQYLSLEGMLNSMLLSKDTFCTACFNGEYPVKHKKRLSKSILETGR